MAPATLNRIVNLLVILFSNLLVHCLQQFNDEINECTYVVTNSQLCTFVTSNTGGFDSFSNISRFLSFSSLALPVTGKYCLFSPVFFGVGSDGYTIHMYNYNYRNKLMFTIPCNA